jgi:hypothetical protein
MAVKFQSSFLLCYYLPFIALNYLFLNNSLFTIKDLYHHKIQEYCLFTQNWNLYGNDDENFYRFLIFLFFLLYEFYYFDQIICSYKNDKVKINWFNEKFIWTLVYHIFFEFRIYILRQISFFQNWIFDVLSYLIENIYKIIYKITYLENIIWWEYFFQINVF